MDYYSFLDSYIKTTVFTVPIICSLSVLLFVLFSINSCGNSLEKAFRTIVSIFFLTTGALWTILMAYTCLGCTFGMPVVPVIIRSMLSVVAYGVPMAVIATRYINKRAGFDARSSRYIRISIAAESALLISGIVLASIGEYAAWDIVNALFIPTGQILLTDYVLNRCRSGKRLDATESSVAGSEHLTNTDSIAELMPLLSDRSAQPELSRKELENYFHLKRPYIDPEFKLTDLAKAMDVNRSEMSNFINQTYGINFKRYVNRWRLVEYRRLMSLPSNELKNPLRILPMAGFTDSRHYQRVLRSEEEEERRQNPEQEKDND